MAPSDFHSVLTAVERCEPDEIYYFGRTEGPLVGLSFDQPKETLDSILTAVLNLLGSDAAAEDPGPLYNASSSESFGDTGETRANGLTPFRPRSPYAVAKASAHWLVANYRAAYGLWACNGILFNHESPLRPQRFVTQKIVRAAQRIARGSGERLTLEGWTSAGTGAGDRTT